MSLPAKTNLVDTMANVHLMYLVEVWEHVPSTLLHKLDGHRLQAYRAVQGRLHSGHSKRFTDDE
eukprot:1332792-Pyramimonas_sp.AAC.1